MKKILAVAIATAFAAPAFAATSNVDVYGKLHVSVSVFDDHNDTLYNDTQISSNASRFGIKGSEDLGGGLAAIWQFESGMNLDEQTGTLASRNSFVGLKGGFGTALVGNHDTPLKGVGRAVDLFGDTMADSRNVLGGGSDTRAKNVVAYMSPDFTGLSFAAAYSTDLGTSNNNGDAADASVYNLSATYKNGPLYLGLGYGDGDGHELAGVGKHIRAAAGFTMGNLKFVGQYDKLDDDNTVLPLAQAGDFDAWMLGAAYTMGNIVLKANYMDGEYDDAATGYDVEQFTIGADYNLSKRTAVYVLYADGKNITLGSGGGSSDRIAGAAVAGDDDVSVISLGMTHTF
ncbi:MAG: hypothetical protein A2X71_06685 [Thiobacillus sp. GWE1_62_9]|nr:MAG: hypothetical protein A2X71_06685 [Thiobacillus sp. GWE1_62_9]